ncbi:MAG: sulfate/molybdate ABC transporter ATP-binding protein [Bilifractor sp.]|jgi:molybdate transport system ATP-binding protein
MQDTGDGGQKRELTIRLRKKLNEFDLDIDLKETSSRIGILGPSGCGKSMTLKSIAGIVTPDAGRIRLGERLLFDSDSKINVRPQKRRIGYLFQNYALFPTMTAEQNIAAGLTGDKRTIRERVKKMIREFHLEGLEKEYPGRLSGGQQQRVALARLMAYEPDVILLDEPFSAMDAFLRDQLQEQMAEILARYDGSMILVSHNRDEIYRFCDHLIILDRGHVVCEGNTRDVFADPKKKTAARLTGCKNYTDLVRTDVHHARLVDWGIDIETKREIPEGTDCLGYRAHDFIPLWGTRETNSFPAVLKNSADLPFEQNFYFLPQGEMQEDNPRFICWFVQRDLQTKIREKGMPDFLQLAEKDMLFLQKQ